MELSFNDLKKREVINVADGSSLGNITDMVFSFPQGEIAGIVVPGRKICFLLRPFLRDRIYIDQSRIIKIGGDVILVDIDACKDYGKYSGGRIKKVKPQKPPVSPCPPVPPCPPKTPMPPCPPPAPCPPACGEDCHKDCDFDEGYYG